ncbi:hypothetical protein Tsubulata_045472, partial [Turnera subulata]
MMRPVREWIVLILLFVLSYCCYGCLKEERDALLQIKAWINPLNKSQHPQSSNKFFSSWVDNEKDDGCCKWRRVECNSTTKRSLDLGSNQIVCCLQEFYNLTNLEELFLDGFYLPRSVLLSIGASSSLKILSLNQCNLSGTLPDLYLSGNELVGVLPPCLRNLSSLLVMDLSSNQFTGNIASSPLVGLISLQYLSCSSNQFRVPTLFASFYNQSDLKLISCDNSELILEPNLQTSTPVLQLNFFSMSNCTSETRKAEYPYFLYFQYDLRILDLSDYNFGGQFPSWLLQNNTRVKRLYLKNNALVGPLQLHYLVSNLSTIDISSNYMDGQTLKTICSFFPSLVNLIIADNHLTGGIPPCFANMSYLRYLDIANNRLSSGFLDFLPLLHSSLWFLKLSNNNFEGQISPTFFNQTRLLEFLDLSENNLSGSIPSCTNLSRISHVHLYQNQFSGPLTYAFFNSTNLVTLDLRENQITGTVPNWISSLSKLSVLLLKDNNFHGDLPVELCLLRQLSILDLSQNMFSGRRPSCLSNINFMAFWIKKEAVSGKLSLDSGEDSSLLSIDRKKLAQQGINLIQRTLWPGISVEEVIEFTTKKFYYTYKNSILSYMSGVVLSCNRFTGEIPPELGNLRGLRALNLSHNNLTGAIPPSFSNLKQIESLDLSHNGLGGGIPQQLTELYSLSVFSVAYNNLSGKTPEMKGQFAIFDQTSYEGIPLLCGPPLGNNCMEKSQLPSGLDDSSGNQEGDGFMDIGAFCISFELSYTTVVVTIATVLCINPYWRRLWFYFIE